eukprot:Gb_25250 [translate_table: standard]
MEAADLSLYTTVQKSGAKKLYRAYACVYFAAILGLIYYRIANLPREGRFPWLMVFGAELCFAFFWILEQAAFRWWPIERQAFPEKLYQRFEENLPDIDIFVCTADPVKEPAVSVINTVLSAMAFDYPVEKMACYLSDDGGSPLTFYALLEASSFAKSWLPFCNKYFIEQRCPEKFFSENIQNAYNVPISEWKKLKKLYEEMKDRINRTVEIGAIPDVIQKKHNGFKEWTSTVFTSRNHPSVVQILLEKGKDLDDEGGNLPSLIYVSREKRPGHPHHYKAGALNVLGTSLLMSSFPKLFMASLKTISMQMILRGSTKFTPKKWMVLEVQSMQIGMIYGCAVEDVLIGFAIHSRGWKSAYCNPKRKAFLGCAPVNLNDTLTQHKRWSAGLLELFVRLCLINGLSLFPKVSDTWFPLFAFLLIGAYSHSMIELMWVGASFKKVGFEVTSKVVDMEAIKRYEAEIFIFVELHSGPWLCYLRSYVAEEG